MTQRHVAGRRRSFAQRQHEIDERRRRAHEAPDTPEAQVIERMKAAGLVVVRPEDVDKPWADQRLMKTPLGEAHERELRRQHPELFPQ